MKTRSGSMGEERQRLAYHERPTAAELTPFVRALWRLEAGGPDDPGDARDPASRVEPILPDGCVEIVFHFGEPFFERSAAGTMLRQSSALLVGPSSRPVWLAR